MLSNLKALASPKFARDELGRSEPVGEVAASYEHTLAARIHNGVTHRHPESVMVTVIKQ